MYQPKQKQAALSWGKGITKCPILPKGEQNKLVLNVVTVSLLPISFVEQPSFKELISACQPGIELPTCYSITKSLEKKQETLRNAVKSAMSKIEWIATTTDCWSAHRRSYLGVTAHWLCFDSFKRESVALACQRVKGSHTYDVLAQQLKATHSKYGISSKVVKTTTDNCSNFVKAFAVFAPSEDELEVSPTNVDSVLSNEIDSLELPHRQRCAAHSLNLVSTTDAAIAEKDNHYKKISRATFAKCQALWHKAGRAVQAKEVVDDESPLQVIRPCATRWNSVFDAIHRLNRINKSFGSLTLNNIFQKLDLPWSVLLTILIIKMLRNV